MPYAVVLNSRQSKTPVGTDPWVAFTLRAVRHAVDRGYTILGSLGMNTWELATWAAGACGGRVMVYIPFPYAAHVAGAAVRTDDPESLIAIILHEFHLSQSQAEFRFQPSSQTGHDKKSHWPVRDAELVAMADIVYPVSIRSGGGLESLLDEEGSRKKSDDRFRVRYQIMNAHPSYPPENAVINSALAGKPWPYITHWTRTSSGKWPGETAAMYYRDMTNSRGRYARSAIATLQRILDEQLVRATSRHIRDGFPVVSFTALPPEEAIRLMRWRRRYVQWSFESYGIAIDRETALSLGIQPVIYGEPDEYPALAESDRPFFQNRGLRGGDWIIEQEWRHPGDLDLSRIPPLKRKIITQLPAEIGEFHLNDSPEIVALYCYSIK